MARRSHTRKHRHSKRRTTRKASSWAKSVTKVYHQMKRTNPSASLQDAMKHASQLRRQGKL